MNPKVVGRGRSCLCVRKVLLAADYVHCKVDIKEEVAEPAKFKVIIAENVELWDAVSGMKYLARKSPETLLYGKTLDEMAVVDSWLHYVESNMMVPLVAWMVWDKLKADNGEKIRSDFLSCLQSRVEPHLRDHTYLATERITIADLDLVLMLDYAIHTFDKNLIQSLPNTQRWFETVASQTLVKKQLAAAVDATKKEAKQEVPKKDVAKKEAKQKGEKQEPQSSAADIEEQIAAEEKARASKSNPLDSLAPSPFVLDAWKREYSNTKELRAVAMPYFWTNFDAAGWSLWYMRYDKVEGENVVGFITANMLRGFLQRLDPAFRKYSFGVINVVGEPGNFDIQGVWLMRGQEIPNELKEHPSFEYNTFRKLDSAADKALIEDYWCNDNEVEGRPIDSSNVWK